MLLILLGVTLGTFAPTLRFPFMSDDYLQIVQNQRVKSWSFVPEYFTTHLWVHVSGTVPRFYRPVFLLILRICHALFGLWTPGWHLAAVLSHLAAVASVFWLVRQWKSDQIALVAAALFALHPVHTEVIAWVTCIAEPWLTVALIASLVFARRSGLPNVIASCAMLAVALLLKETAVVWPVVLFLALYDGFNQTLRRLLPQLAVVVGYLLLRLAVLGNIAYVIPRTTPPDPSLVPTAFTHYILHLVWPVGLSVYSSLHPTWAYLFAAVPMFAALLWVALRGEYERVAVLVLLCPLLPALNLGGMQLDALVQDRYLYLPSVGFVMLVALLLNQCPKPAIAFALLAMIFGCVYETRTWSDGEHFYARGLEVAPDNSEVRDGLARIYAQQGKYLQAIKLLEPVVQSGASPSPYLWQSLMTEAYCYERLGNISVALSYYSEANSLRPTPEVEQHIFLLRSYQ